MKMIEVNLLPDIKQEVLSSRRLRDVVATWSIIISSSGAALVLLLVIIVILAQGIIISSQQKQIDSDFNKYKSYPGVSGLLTIQNQLKKLNQIHKKKPITSRVLTLLAQLISKNKLDVKTVKIETQPHANKIIIEGYSATGYIEVERLVKIINETRIAFIDNATFDKLSENKDKVQADKDFQSEVEKSDFENLNKDKASLLSDPVLGENSEGKKVLTFKLGIAVQDNFFKDNSKSIVISGISYKDATDSYLSIPQSILGSLKKTEEDKAKEKAGAASGTQSTTKETQK